MSKISFNYEKRDGKGPAQGLCVMAGGSGAASSTFSFCSILSARASSFFSSLVLRLAAASGGGDFESDTHTKWKNQSVVWCWHARMWAGGQFVISTHTHTHTHPTEFKGNTFILVSPLSEVGPFLPHLVVTWLLSANQGLLNKPQDMSLQFFWFVSPSEMAASVLTDPHCDLFFLTFLILDKTTRVHCVLSFFFSYRFGL